MVFFIGLFNVTALRLNHGGDAGPEPGAGFEIIKFKLPPICATAFVFLLLLKASSYSNTFYLNLLEKSIKISKRIREI